MQNHACSLSRQVPTLFAEPHGIQLAELTSREHVQAGLRVCILAEGGSTPRREVMDDANIKLMPFPVL